MSQIWALLLLTGACLAQAVPPPPSGPPPYVESLNSVHKAEYYLHRNLLSLRGGEPITDYRRHFAVLVTAFGELAERLSKSCVFDYEDEYITSLDRTIPLGLTNPKNAIAKVKHYEHLLNNQTQKVQDIIKACVDPRPEDCDELVDYIVRNDPIIYQDEARLLLEAGALSNALIDNQESFVNYSKSYTEEAALINGAARYESFIFKLDDVIKHLNYNSNGGYRAC